MGTRRCTDLKMAVASLPQPTRMWLPPAMSNRANCWWQRLGGQGKAAPSNLSHHPPEPIHTHLDDSG